MSSDDLTVQILVGIRDEVREIRDEVRATNQRLDRLEAGVGAGLEAVRHEMDAGFEAVRHEIFEVELRAATRHTELSAATINLHALIEDRFALRDRVARCETDIADIKHRLG